MKIIHKAAFLNCFLLAFFFVSLCNSAIYGQKNYRIEIEGQTTFNEGEEVRISATTDYISLRPVTLGATTIDNTGKFHLSFDVPNIVLAQIEVRTSKADIFFVPGYHYDLQLDMDPELFDMITPELYGGFLQVKSNKIDTLDLNYKINKFSNFFNRQLDQFAPYLFRKNMEMYDTLLFNIQNQFEIRYAPDNYYLSYLYYTIAMIDELIYANSPQHFFSQYLDNDYILYDNPAYMSVFKDFYHQYLYNSPHISKQILSQYINETADYPALFNAVGRDPFLVNERIRELVIMDNLFAFANSDEFVRDHVLQLLHFIKDNTHFANHKTIVEHVLFELNKYGEETITPRFMVKKQDGSSVNLIENYKGKWVYLQVFNVNCLDCIREMLIIKDLHEKYGDKITFVSLSLDFDFTKFQNFTNKNSQFTWDFVHFNSNFEWLRDLEIGSLPDNILFDPEGHISLRYPPDPSKNLSQFLLLKFREN
ncbi:MAG: redoxin domain-containing protein [Bacteroidales bacterium]|jgi:thiol-disulfide isomerase/thioredoxin|nr:redoxin domain-containing protein [Bacteroidales bacterium]